jgi:CelD/BcsL family acetyltransferase involved in cellulose biosynthesis
MAAQFAILDAKRDDDRRRWLDLWIRWPHREVQAHPAYLELFAEPTHHVRAAILDAGDRAVLYPFLQRPLPDDLGIEGSDLTSPYGYGGPYAWGSAVESLAEELWPRFDEWTRAERVVSEIVRLAVGAVDQLPYPGERIERQHNVIVPVATPPDELWTQFAHKVRKNVNKARNAGVHVDVDDTGTRLADFVRIYAATMARREAADVYRFPHTFFEQLTHTLPGQCCYFHAIHEDRVISTEVALVSAQRIYSFLGGTDESAFDLRPNDLLKFEMIRWAHANGKTEFVLGGGYRPDDGIYRYKQSFAPSGSVPFYTGQRIFDAARYERLTTARSEAASRAQMQLASGFFPAYRAPLVPG